MTINRAIPCFLLILVTVFWPSLTRAQVSEKSPATKPGKRPNIVFIFSDDHALQAMGAYGSKVNQTPQLDRLARSGMVFDRSYCANSICGPSRACILTGKHSHLNGFLRNGDRFDGSQTTFAKLLQASGYQTAMIGKWHLETNPTGFDYWEILPGQGSYYNPDFIQMDGSRKRYEGYCTDLLTDFSLDWLDKRDKDRPFLLMTQHKAPHRNWAPHPRHFGKYKLGTIPEPETLFDDYSGRSKLLQENEMTIARHFHWSHDMKLKGPNTYPEHFVDGVQDGEYQRMTDAQRKAWDDYYEPENQAFLSKLKAGELTDQQITQWKYQRYMHDYLGSVAAVDDNVGRILDYLEVNNLTDNTIVVYSSDQGFYLGEHGWYDKRWMFEESLRMPFLIRWPGLVKPDTRSGALIQNIDYGPTFLEAAGLAIPAEMQGKSILPILQNNGQQTANWRDAIYYAYYENDAVHMVPMHDGVRTERYKAMHFPKTNEWNLFDLEKDPQEMVSVHTVDEYQPVLQELKQRYVDLKKLYRVNSATISATRGDEKWWKDRDNAKRAEAKNGGFQLVFIGDSITQGWEGAGKEVWQQSFGSIKSLNLGFSGDRTEHVLWRLSRNQMGPNKPAAVVILIGTNNTGHRMQPPEEIAEGVESIVNMVKAKSPQTKILLLGILPRGLNDSDPMRLNNEQVNHRISLLHDGENVFYKNINASFVEPDGTISNEVMPDRLHLSAEGYRRWAEAITPILKQWSVLP